MVILKVLFEKAKELWFSSFSLKKLLGCVTMCNETSSKKNEVLSALKKYFWGLFSVGLLLFLQHKALKSSLQLEAENQLMV